MHIICSKAMVIFPLCHFLFQNVTTSLPSTVIISRKSCSFLCEYIQNKHTIYQQVMKKVHVITFHTAGVSRRQVKHFTNVTKMSKFWNLVTMFGITMKNFIQKNTNMPGIGSLIYEIDIKGIL